MKYMLLIYTDENSWSEAERESCFAESIELTHQLHADGKFLGASPLHPVATATSVRIRGGKRLVTDGPFAETHEQLGGYFLVDAQDLDEAIDIAARIPVPARGLWRSARCWSWQGCPSCRSGRLPMPPEGMFAVIPARCRWRISQVRLSSLTNGRVRLEA